MDCRNPPHGSLRFTNTSGQNSPGGDERRVSDRSPVENNRAPRFPQKARGRDGSSTSRRGADGGCETSIADQGEGMFFYSRCGKGGWDSRKGKRNWSS